MRTRREHNLFIPLLGIFLFCTLLSSVSEGSGGVEVKGLLRAFTLSGVTFSTVKGGNLDC